ncbi:MAG TPA: hypothetical protein VFC99_21465 [Acidimicrobiia bacterium]|nr:hypothetical protein [Acidimicrobiia bacterium]
MQRAVGMASFAAITMLVVPAAAGIAAAAGTPAPAPKRAVVEITRTFVDRSRPTPPNEAAHEAGAPSRTLPTTIWIPAGKGPFPLIVFAHGNGSDPQRYAATVAPWAAAGYVVAAPTFPISSRDGGSVGGVADVANQPRDVEFVLGRMLALARHRGVLHHKVDAKHVGVAGHSLGAITTLGVAERSCCRDARVGAAISISGTPLVSGTDFAGHGPPLMLVHGDHDPTVNYAGSTSSYARATPPKYLVTVVGGHHDDFLGGGPNTAAVAEVNTATTDFWDAYLKGDRAALRRLPNDAGPGVTTMQSDPGSTNGKAASS